MANDKSGSANNVVFQELYYHKTSALRVQLGTFLEKTKLKMETIPVIDANAKPRKYKYDESVPLVFDVMELYRIKKIFENLLTPSKPQNEYEISHYFEGEDGKKNGSSAHFKRVAKNNLDKADPKKDPFIYPAMIIMTLNSRGKSCSFGFTDEESYMFVNLLGTWAEWFILEKARVTKILINERGSNKAGSSYVPAHVDEPSQPNETITIGDFSANEDVPF